jgi:hypothetical protein
LFESRKLTGSIKKVLPAAKGAAKDKAIGYNLASGAEWFLAVTTFAAGNFMGMSMAIHSDIPHQRCWY